MADNGSTRAGRTSVRARRAVVAMVGTFLLVICGFTIVTELPGGALTLTSSDGYTSVMPDPSDGTVTPDTPYDSGQAIDVVVTANPVINAAGLAAASLPDTGTFYVIECSDTGGTSAGLPTSVGQCDNGTLTTTPKAADGSVNQTGGNAFPVYSLPTAATNFDTTATCGLSPNPCVVAIFAVSPSAGGFADPHLFSAPFDVSAGDGSNTGDNPGDGSAPVTTATSPTNSTVLTSQAILAADGSDTSKITVTLKDTNGAAVTTGKQVSLSQGSGHSTIDVQGVPSTTATTDASGQAVFSVTDTTAEPVTYTVTDTSDSNLQLSTQPTITFATPTVTPANSSITANPTAVAQAGSSTITVTLDDQATAPQPLAGKLVTLAQGPGGSVITPASPGSDTTNIQGKATFTVTDTTAQTVTYTATGDGVALTGHSASVTFGTLTASATASLVTADNPVVSSVANGGSQPTGGVTVTLLAADGVSAVEGKTITLAASPGSSALVSPSSAVTDANGQAVFSVSDTTAESVTFTATDTTDQLPIMPTATVTFEPPGASGTTSAVTVSPVAPGTVPADGVTSATLTVTIKDQFGNPLANKVVSIAGVVTGTGVPSQTSRVAAQVGTGGVVADTTDSSGKVEFLANDTAAESVTYQATDTTDTVVVAQTVNVTYTAGVPQVSDSSVAASPTAVPADGSTPSTITVVIADHNGNPVPGKTVTLTALNGSSVVVGSSPTTNSAGEATFEVADSTAEIVAYRATDSSDSLALVGEEVAVTFGSPAPVVPVIADSVILSNRITVPADGSSAATITVILNDGNGLGLSGKRISLVSSPSSSSVLPATGTTDATGAAAFTVTDRTPGIVTYSISDLSDGIPLTGLSTTVTFMFAPNAAASNSSAPLNKPIVSIAATPDGSGYWLAASDGGVFTKGDAHFYGSTGSLRLNKPIVGMAATPDGKGYWLVAADGGIFREGDATFYGSAGALHLNKPIVGMAATPDGKGYWLVAADGGVFTEGDAIFYGSTGALHLNKPIVGMAATPDGRGYWLVAADGGVFREGDAAFYGSAGALHLNKPIVGMAATPDGKGYWLVASDGGIFRAGDAAFYGSTGSLHLNKPIVGMATTADGKGYWLAASDGGIFRGGDAVFYGSMAG